MDYKITANLYEQNRPGDTLEKALPRELVETGNFRQLLDYMTDGREDNLNPSYDTEQLDMAEKIRGYLRNSKGGNVLLCYQKLDGSFSPNISLEDRLRDHQRDMLKTETVEEPNGEEISYPSIDLEIGYSGTGGI